MPINDEDDDDYYDDDDDGYDDGWRDYDDDDDDDYEEEPCYYCGAYDGEPHTLSCRYYLGPTDLELDYLTRPPQDEQKIEEWLNSIVDWFDCVANPPQNIKNRR